MLERKYAYAFASGGAGAVQWIWNTNFYMDNANESQIGALRVMGLRSRKRMCLMILGGSSAKRGVI